jgi:hypothetical protein
MNLYSYCDVPGLMNLRTKKSNRSSWFACLFGRLPSPCPLEGGGTTCAGEGPDRCGLLEEDRMLPLVRQIRRTRTRCMCRRWLIRAEENPPELVRARVDAGRRTSGPPRSSDGPRTRPRAPCGLHCLSTTKFASGASAAAEEGERRSSTVGVVTRLQTGA